MLKIAIIIGSTRPGRKGEAVAKWAYDIARQRGNTEFELLDLADFNLPLLDEPLAAMSGQYSQPQKCLLVALMFGVSLLPELCFAQVQLPTCGFQKPYRV